MRIAIRLAAVAAVLVLMFPAAVQARAIPPLGVSFDVATTLDTPNGGPFVARGPAVDFGWICPAGQTEDIYNVGRSRGWPGTNFQVVKRFTCDNGTGYFDLKLQVRVDRKGNLYSWNVVGGTDSYAKMTGSGSGYGDFISDTQIADHLFGTVLLHG